MIAVAQPTPPGRVAERFGFLTDERFVNAEVRKLDSNLNSADHDRIDAIAPDGSILFLSRTPKREGKADVFFASRRHDGWSLAELLRGEINDSTNNFIGGITADSRTLAVAKEGEIAFSHKVAGVWLAPEIAAIDSFYTDADLFNFALSPDGKMLVMALERKDSYGETDLYISHWLSGNRWSTPTNAGPEINTRGFESGPTFSPDGTTIYFSSTGSSGYGGYDLFSTVVQAGGKLSGARNLGRQINSEQNELFFVLHPDGTRAYFTSDRAGTDGEDIFEATFSSIDTGIRFTGKIIDQITGRPVIAHFEFHLLPSNIKIVLDSSSADGTFSFVLPYLAKYQMHVTSREHFPITEIVGFDRYEERHLIERNISMEPLVKGRPIDLVGINFETGSARLTENSTPALNAIRQLLIERPNLKVEISGHTDNVGEREANLALSIARAEAVVRYLTEAGIDARRLIARGFGESKPVRSNATEQGREVNRRVELKVVE